MEIVIEVKEESEVVTNTENLARKIPIEIIDEFFGVLAGEAFNHPEIYQSDDIEAVKIAQRNLLDEFLASK